MRAGTVAIVGRSNVGKSTLLNQILGERLAIVSPLPQTTRDALLGVVRREGAEEVQRWCSRHECANVAPDRSARAVSLRGYWPSASPGTGARMGEKLSGLRA